MAKWFRAVLLVVVSVLLGWVGAVAQGWYADFRIDHAVIHGIRMDADFRADLAFLRATRVQAAKGLAGAPR
jgi:hypothetical protein